MLPKSVLTSLVASGFLLSAFPAGAQFARPEDAVKYRQAALTIMNTHLNRIGAMANGRVPLDANTLLEDAETLGTVSRLPWAGFVPATERISSRAKPEIWAELPKFKERSEALMAETAKLVAAARTQNLDQIKAAFNATDSACRACHNAYRSR